MKRPSESAPALPLGLRIGLFMSLAVLGAVLLTALVLEILGRGDSLSDAVERLRRSRSIAADRLNRDGEALSRLAVTVSRDPRFYGLLAQRPTERGPTFRQSLEDVVQEFQRDAASEIFDVTDILGATLAASRRAAAPEANRGFSALVREALSGRATRGYRVEGGRLYRLAVVPVPRADGKVVGTLTLGSPVDGDFAASVHHAGGADLLILAGASPEGGDEVDSGARPVASTLTDAGTRSLLATVGPAPRAPDRWTERDVKRVSIAKSPGMAADVPLTGLVEGGSPRLLVATALTPLAGLAAARETLLAVGALASLLALLFGWIAGTRLGVRLKRLRAAVCEMRSGNYDWPLPAAGRDETGSLVAEFDAMREAQRREIDRLVEADRMKMDFLAVTAQEIAMPAHEIAALAKTVAAGRAGPLKPEVVRRLRDIYGRATNLARLAEDLAGLNVVSRFGAADAPPPAGGDGPEATVEVVAEEEESFRPVVPRPEPETIGGPSRSLDGGGDEGDGRSGRSGDARGRGGDPGAGPPLQGPSLDVGALIEAIATDLILDAAAKGVGVDLEVESDLLYGASDGRDLEARIRGHAGAVLRSARPGATLSLAGRRHAAGIEVAVSGGERGPAPLKITLPASAETAKRQ